MNETIIKNIKSSLLLDTNDKNGHFHIQCTHNVITMLPDIELAQSIFHRQANVMWIFCFSKIKKIESSSFKQTLGVINYREIIPHISTDQFNGIKRNLNFKSYYLNLDSHSFSFGSHYEINIAFTRLHVDQWEFLFWFEFGYINW